MANNDQDKSELVAVKVEDLERMTIRELYDLAKKYDVPRYTSLRKRDLIFAILEAQAKSHGLFFGTGVLEILPDGYG